MNFSKSILSLALLVSVSAASAFPGESLFSKEAISYRFGQASEAAASVWAKVPTYQQVKVGACNLVDGAQFKVASNAKAVWAKVPSRTDLSETFAARAYDVKQVVAPYMTKKVAAVSAAAGVVVAGSVVAYKKGYFAKAAQAVSNAYSKVTDVLERF